MKNLQITIVLGLMILLGVSASAQDIIKIHDPIKLSGPRFGFTYIGGDLGKTLDQYDMSRYRSQFGWQFETRWFETSTGFQGLVETVVLLTGFETDDPNLSASLLFGFRTKEGFEAGAGPNITSTGDHALVIAVGHTVKLDYVNIPFNFAISPSSDAVKYTVLMGFNIRRH